MDGDDDDYGGLQQPEGGYVDAGVADPPTDYGDQYPPSPYDKNPKKPGAAPTPLDLRTQVKQDLTNINRPLGANLIDMRFHSNHVAFESDPVNFYAWTNTAQDIYVDLNWFNKMFRKNTFGKSSKKWTKDEKQNNARAAALICIWHESEHVDQFKNIRPAQSFEDEIKYEKDAYHATAVWVKDTATKDYLIKTIKATTDFVAFWTTAMDSSDDDFTKAYQDTQISKDEDSRRKWMQDNNYMPKKINKNAKYAHSELYKTDPPPSP
jgi:hypothetical protein